MKLTAFSQGVINNDPSGFKKYEKGRHDLGKVVDVDTGSGSDWLANVCISPGDLRKYFVNDDSEDVMNSMCQNCGGTGGDEQFILCSGGESDGSLCNNGAHANWPGSTVFQMEIGFAEHASQRHALITLRLRRRLLPSSLIMSNISQKRVNGVGNKRISTRRLTLTRCSRCTATTTC